MSDGFVQVPIDSTGKKIDVSEITRADATIVERQRVVIGDDDSILQNINNNLAAILKEVRHMRACLSTVI